ncbi:MAG: hypothetical protein JST16_05960 [Bdellovibrionales bacterium]|nr:hypothetical protein [Bdellovibrionales bacterium]
MKKLFSAGVGFGAVLTMLSACSSTDTFKVAQLQEMGKVAVVGFELIQRGPADLSLSGVLNYKKSGGVDGVARIEKTAHAIEVYKLSTEALVDGMKWKVIPYADLVHNPAYSAVFADRMSGFRNIPTVGEHFVIHHAENIMDWGAIERMEAPQRAALAQKLGVGGLVVLNIQASSEEGGLLSLATGAKFKPQAEIRIRVYGTNGEERLWDSSQIRGEIIAGEGRSLGGKDNIEKVNLLIQDAVRSAWKKAIENYRRTK